MRRNLPLAAPALAAAVSVLVAGAPARAASPPQGAAAAAADEARGLDVRALPGTLMTGRAAIFEITAPAAQPAIRGLKGRFDGRPVIAVRYAADGRRWRVLAPVHVDREPGDASLSVQIELQDGTRSLLERSFSVEEAPYDRRDITVGRSFVSPSKAQRKRARRESRELDRVLKKPSAERLWVGSFVRPVTGVETSPFGTLRTYNKRRKSRHLGLDLDGKVGDPITAAQRGKVVLAKDRFYSGGTVVIDHGEGLFTMYFHMSRIDVKAGDLVDKGQQIGHVGATGQVTGPHLHFSVKLAGTYVDPAHVLAADWSEDPAAPSRLDARGASSNEAAQAAP